MCEQENNAPKETTQQDVVHSFLAATIGALEGMKQPVPATMHRGHIPGSKNIDSGNFINYLTNEFVSPEKIAKGECFSHYCCGTLSGNNWSQIDFSCVCVDFLGRARRNLDGLVESCKCCRCRGGPHDPTTLRPPFPTPGSPLTWLVIVENSLTSTNFWECSGQIALGWSEESCRMSVSSLMLRHTKTIKIHVLYSKDLVCVQSTQTPFVFPTPTQTSGAAANISKNHH